MCLTPPPPLTYSSIPERLILAKKEPTAVDHPMSLNQTKSPTWRIAGTQAPFTLLKILFSFPHPSIAWLRDFFQPAVLGRAEGM